MKSRVPGPPGTLLLGNLKEVRGDPLGFFVRSWREYGDIVRFRFGPIRAFLLVHPKYIQHVLQSHEKNYDKRTPGYFHLKTLLGNGLLTSDGDVWRRRRRILQPAFTHQRVRSFAAAIGRAAEDMADEWTAHARRQRCVDVQTEMARITLRVIGETLLGVDLTSEAEAVNRASTEASEEINYRNYLVAPLPLRIPTTRNRRLRGALRRLEEVVFRVIEKRRGHHNGDDLLSLLTGPSEDGSKLSSRDLRNEVMTMILAGHETTATALAWTWYLLSAHPQVRRRLCRELEEVLGGRTPTVPELDKLTFCDWVLRESMRLYPPVWTVQRRAVCRDNIDGHHIPKNSLIIVSPFLTHRHPHFWEKPEQFHPEHFRPESVAQRAPFAYLPFSGGPRTCIGATLATVETKIILATLAQRFKLSMVADHPVALQPVIVLRPQHGLLMRIEETVSSDLDRQSVP